MDIVENPLCGHGTLIILDIPLGRTFKKNISIQWQLLYSTPSQSGCQPQDISRRAHQLPHQQASELSTHLFLPSLHTLYPLSSPPPPLPFLSPTPSSSLPSPVQGGVVNAMSFLSLSAVRVASAGDELPVDNFVFAEHSDSQCGVIPPELATCENSPFGRPLFR